MPNHFERLGLPGRFSIDTGELERQYLRLSREVHPDFHGESSETAAAELNEAYTALRDPFRRAEHLLAILGGPTAADQKAMPPAFLMEMLELREQIEQTKDRSGIEAELMEREVGIFAGIAKEFEKEKPDLAAIRRELNSAKYLRGLLRDLRN